ncbi:hypothetical protein KY290_029969 [Solanum tuberosum]|uniref:Uncharacterized protein n=1 Tax=Solanum tuberosum TaxID=4113 RepID=A0ABQ7UM77_SOLTU|nr:hypothetical protein KY285_029067 [Solanum tuberosum]KAH0750737.1 hypothetical protein KY290_029969 [Solanum tuberosum]
MDIEEHKLEHMWEVVTEKFDSDGMNDQRDNALQHMRKLWNNWRGSLHKKVKSKSLHEVLKDVPMGVDKSDWEWLVKEHFLSDKFKEASARNSVNRSKLCMPHRTGSKPIREIVYEMMVIHQTWQLFSLRHVRREMSLSNLNPLKNRLKFTSLYNLNHLLLNIEVVERCFGPQCKSHVVGFGGGITTKELKGGTTSKDALWEELKTLEKKRNQYKNAWIF